jgi:hypothetical protein
MREPQEFRFPVETIPCRQTSDCNQHVMRLRSIRLKSSPAGWPVWLLFAAWLGANSPQELTLNMMTWAGQARHFSHQDRLRSEVAFILAGKPAAPARLAANPAPARPSAPPVVAEVVLKKIDLYVSVAAEPAPPGAQGLHYSDGTGLKPDSVRAEPLTPPPRGRFLA